jgi:D-alanyl-D-alanine carboxypeptidase
VPLPAAAAAAIKAAKVARTAVANRHWILAIAGLVATVAVAAPLAVVVLAIGGTQDPAQAAGLAASAAALAEIPPEALAAYRDAGAAWGVDWAILAAVGFEECRHGTYQAPGCNPPDTVNSAGARGWMQFIGSTWRQGLGQYDLESRTSPPAADGQGYATDGDHDGDADPWSWPDAAHSAARYLAALGVNQDPSAALLGYNHDSGYVDRVLATAARYRAPADGTAGFTGTAGNVPLVTVEGITVHAQIGPQVAAMVQAARADGLTLTGGGYRDPAEQIALRRAHCGTSDYAIYQMPSSQCSPPTARPGSSNHELGLAIDLSCNGILIRSHSDPCFVWLAAHAASYGLSNLPSEPWHWSVDGT